MSETLRPSTLGEILDRTAQLYRRNFWLFAASGAADRGDHRAERIGSRVIFLVPGIRAAT